MADSVPLHRIPSDEGGAVQSAVLPPSTTSGAPVMSADASGASNRDERVTLPASDSVFRNKFSRFPRDEFPVRPRREFSNKPLNRLPYLPEEIEDQ